MTTYRCNIDRWTAFTKGKIYKTNNGGRLVDNDGDERNTPHFYNIGEDCTQFIKIPKKNLIGGKLL